MRKLYFTQNQSIFTVQQYFAWSIDFGPSDRMSQEHDLIARELKLHFDNIGTRPTWETDYTLKPWMEGKVSFNGRAPQNINGTLTLWQWEKLIPSSRTVNRTEYKIVDSSWMNIGTLSIDTSTLNQQYADNRKEQLGGINNAEQTDRFIDNFTWTPQELFGSPKYKANFDNIVNNWSKISNSAVKKINLLVMEYATSYGLNIPSNDQFKLTVTKTKDGQPWLQIDGTWYIIYNSAKNPNPQESGRLIRETNKVVSGQSIAVSHSWDGEMIWFSMDGIYYEAIPWTKRWTWIRNWSSYQDFINKENWQIIKYYHGWLMEDDKLIFK
jgi:hypothetical protein